MVRPMYSSDLCHGVNPSTPWWVEWVSINSERPLVPVGQIVSLSMEITQLSNSVKSQFRPLGFKSAIDTLPTHTSAEMQT